MRRRMKQGLTLGGLAVLAALVCLPVIWVLAGSIKSSVELSDSLSPILLENGGRVRFTLWPLFPTLRHFMEVLLQSPSFFVVFWNSVRIAVLTLGGQLMVAVPAAWAFARFPSRGNGFLFTLYTVLMMMPFQVTMLSSYLVLDNLGLMGRQAAVILPAVFSTFPVFLIYRGFTEIPEGLVEAARIDGAGDWRIFFHIGLPLGSSGILSAAVLSFLEIWNLIEQPLAFLEDKALWPLSLYLPEVGLGQAGTAFAASVITLIPAVLVFVMGQDYLEKGIVAAAMKE